MEAEYVMLTRFMRMDQGEWTLRVAEDIHRSQSADGTWRMYYGAPGDLSTSIERYLGQKLTFPLWALGRYERALMRRQ